MKMNYKNVEKIIQKLASDKHTISFAESCTGGRLAAAFTSVGGASDVFDGSVVSYSNEIKQAWLGVTQQTLEKYGAVSSQCVEEMLRGITTLTETIRSDYALAVSGIAGPTGGTETKPVGTVYIGVKTPTSQEVYHCVFDGDRNSVQEQSTAFAIRKLEEYLKI